MKNCRHIFSHSRKRGLWSPLSRRKRTWLSYQRTEYSCLRLCEIDWIRIEYPWIEYFRDIHRFKPWPFEHLFSTINFTSTEVILKWSWLYKHSVQNYINNLEKRVIWISMAKDWTQCSKLHSQSRKKKWAILKWFSCKETEVKA